MMGRAMLGLKRFAASSSGFTLPELLVGISIAVISFGLMGTGVFRALDVERGWREKSVAVRELRHAASTFAGDALNASSTDLVSEALPVASVALTRIDAEGVPHTTTYSLAGGDMVRDRDGNETVVARNVTNLGFSLVDRTLVLEMEVQSAGDNVVSTSLNTYLRMLQP